MEKKLSKEDRIKEKELLSNVVTSKMMIAFVALVAAIFALIYFVSIFYYLFLHKSTILNTKNTLFLIFFIFFMNKCIKFMHIKYKSIFGKKGMKGRCAKRLDFSRGMCYNVGEKLRKRSEKN